MLPIPEVIKTVARHTIGLPGLIIPYAVQKPVLHIALNRAFREPLKHGELEFLEGKKIRIRLTDMHLDWLIEAGPNGFQPIDLEWGEDVSISGEMLDFVLLATRQVDHDTLFFQRRIRIEGDTELGLGVKNTMDSMDWEDLPTPLSRFLQALAVVIGKLEFLKPDRSPGEAAGT